MTRLTKSASIWIAAASVPNNKTLVLDVTLDMTGDVHFDLPSTGGIRTATEWEESH